MQTRCRGAREVPHDPVEAAGGHGPRRERRAQLGRIDAVCDDRTYLFKLMKRVGARRAVHLRQRRVRLVRGCDHSCALEGPRQRQRKGEVAVAHG